MKKLFFCLGLLLFGFATFVQAQPDPRDSIILESKTVAPQEGTGGIVRLKVSIANKDSLIGMALALKESTTVGGAYMTLSHPRTFDGVVEPLTTTLRYYGVVNFTPYNSSSPDRFKITAYYDADEQTGIEPPNATRKAVWELKFDTVLNSTGTIEFDTTRVIQITGLINTVPQDLPVNFLKSTVTVVANPLKGDLNLDGEVRPSDVIFELQAVYLGEVPPAGLATCDLNCDGKVTAADVAMMLNFKYLGSAWPC